MSLLFILEAYDGYQPLLTFSFSYVALAPHIFMPCHLSCLQALFKTSITTAILLIYEHLIYVLALHMTRPHCTPCYAVGEWRISNIFIKPTTLKPNNLLVRFSNYNLFRFCNWKCHIYIYIYILCVCNWETQLTVIQSKINTNSVVLFLILSMSNLL